MAIAVAGDRDEPDRAPGQKGFQDAAEPVAPPYQQPSAQEHQQGDEESGVKAVFRRIENAEGFAE